MPEKLQLCMDSWEKVLPDYTIIKWDLKRFPLEKSLWVKQAFERKKYAFAADYIRLYALATEGGIYLDSDVEVLKSFDNLLHLPYFICEENSPQGVEAAILGAETHTPWVEKCLEYYDKKTFVDEMTGKEHTEVLPSIMKSQISSKYSIKYINGIGEMDISPNVVCVLPSDYFSPKSVVTKKIKITKNTYCIHHFAGTWQPIWKRILLYAWIPLSVKFPFITNRIKKILK